MSHGYIGKTSTNWADMVNTYVQAAIDDLWGEMDGRVLSFDPEKQTATVRPLLRKRVLGQSLQPPDLLDVPVRFVRAGGGSVTYPVKPGDHVVLRPQMRSTDGREAADADGVYDQADVWDFGLSSMEAHLDGGESLNDPIPNFDPQNMHMRFDPDGKFGVKGSPDGKISIEGAEGNVYDIIASMFELIASDQLQINYGSSGGTGHALQNRAQLVELAAKLRSMAL